MKTDSFLPGSAWARQEDDFSEQQRTMAKKSAKQGRSTAAEGPHLVAARVLGLVEGLVR